MMRRDSGYPNKLKIQKYTEDVEPLLKRGKKLTGKRPLAFISDGAKNLHQAYKKEFFTINKYLVNISLISGYKVTITITKWKE